MHELGYAVEIVSTLEDYMKKEKLSEIQAVTLTVGEATGIVPHYMMDCWPAATENTKLAKTELRIDFKKAIGQCQKCDEEYVVSKTHGRCPKCGSEDYTMLSGYEFEITEILAK